MRKVTYGAACSLDGFIATPDGGVDWLTYSKDVQEITSAYWARVDTLVMGRKTWEVAAGASGDGGAMMKGLDVHLFSPDLEEDLGARRAPGAGRSGRVRPQAQAVEGTGDLRLWRGEFAHSLFQAGVIDEVGLNIHPVLLGSGIPFFHDAGRVKLKLLENRTIAGGCVYALYKVVAPGR